MAEPRFDRLPAPGEGQLTAGDQATRAQLAGERPRSGPPWGFCKPREPWAVTPCTTREDHNSVCLGLCFITCLSFPEMGQTLSVACLTCLGPTPSLGYVFMAQGKLKVVQNKCEPKVKDEGKRRKAMQRGRGGLGEAVTAMVFAPNSTGVLTSLEMH